MLFFGEKQVTVLRHPFQHTGQAGAADTLLTGKRNLDAVTFQHLDHGLVGGNVEHLPATAKFDLERPVGTGIHRRRGEVFTVQLPFAPALSLGAVEHMLHEP
ncbi:hypothetical protein D3C78_1760280 [compost metagenome]